MKSSSSSRNQAKPPFHHPVFVLTHHAREPLALEGGSDDLHGLELVRTVAAPNVTHLKFATP